MTRFAALGDSITLGIGDPLPGGGWRGWAALVAECLGEPGTVAFTNLAASGALSTDVAAGQLSAALALRPTVASVVVGVNDTLRGAFDIAVVGRALTATVAALRDAGTVVLTARLPDPGRMLGMPGILARPLARRIESVNAVTDSIAARFRTVHVDAAHHPSTYDSRTWSVDRLHPSERGHRLLASWFTDALAAAGFPVPSRPSLLPSNPEPTRWAQAAWLATKGTRWLVDRSTDLVPDLTRLAATEWWYGVRGVATDVDERLRRDLAEALAVAESMAPLDQPA